MVETDVSEILNFDGALNVDGINSIRVVMAHSESEIDGMNDLAHKWSVGRTKFAFEV